MQSNVTLNKPSQFRYFMCSSSSTPGATNEALDTGLLETTSNQLWDSFQGFE